ncbi:MAG: Ig-like domain-containing protein [Verrucomicrobia bacterium]|nr:Ig-like domain-containing protein [Verrucomicrobiota bacterium]
MASQNGAGGSYGGFGGGRDGYYNDVYGDFRDPDDLGTGGGSWCGGKGGGLIRLTAGELVLDGSIRSDGGSAPGCSSTTSSGGSGGGIRLEVGTLSGSGMITANGGRTSYTTPGAGGGGRVAIYYDHFDGFNPTSQVEVLGGAVGTGNGRRSSPGTLYLNKSGEVGTLIVDSKSTPAGEYFPVWLPEGELFTGDALLRGTGLVADVCSASFLFRNLTLEEGARLTHRAGTANEEYRLELVVSNLLTVTADATIDVSGKGYLAGRTLGNTTAGASTSDAGGSYGGLGGPGDGTPNAVYGNRENPNELGSGAASGAGVGGGLARITAGELDLDGLITADGVPGNSSHGGGSGGGIYIDTILLRGEGSMRARGGRGSYTSDGGGGGGRIAVYAVESAGFDLSGRLSVEGAEVGSGSGSSGDDGTIYLAADVAPVTFFAITPSGALREPVSSILLTCGNPLRSGTFALDDVSLTGPEGEVQLRSLVRLPLFQYELQLQTSADTDGTYTLSIGTDIESIVGGVPSTVHEFSFTIDRTPPVAPSITSHLPSPQTNEVASTSITLEGGREDDSSVWIEGEETVTLGSGDWSSGLTLEQGLNIFHVYAKDEAGNVSTTQSVMFLCDTIPPEVSGMTPPDGAATNVPPATVDLALVEAVSGLDLANTIKSVTKAHVSVPGTWSLNGSVLRFTPSGSLLDGTYTVSVTPVDRFGNEGDLFTAYFMLDRTAPASPEVDPVTTPTIINAQTINGTKEADTAIDLNGAEVIALSGLTTWTYEALLEEGFNTFDFVARDAAGNTSAATRVTIQYDDVAPGPVGITADPEGDGTEIRLDWTGYDEMANGNDIDHYQVFRHTASFTDAGDAEKIGSVPGGTKSFAAEGLPRGEARYFAVIAQDDTGLVNSNVTALSVTPVDVVAPADTTNITFVCASTSLTAVWTPSANTHADLAGYRVYVTNENPGITVSSDTNQYTRGDLDPASAYGFRLRAFDFDANESVGLVVTGYTLLSNPTGLAVTPYDGYVTMSWNGVGPAEFVQHYAVYVATSEYASVTGMSPRITSPANGVSLAGLQNYETNYFAVTTVNLSDGEDPAVTPVMVVTVDDTFGPQIGSPKWNGGSVGMLGAPGTFSVAVSDPAGVGRVEFSINGAVIASDASGSPDYEGFWDVSATPTDGEYALRVTAFDTLGNSNVLESSVTVTLDPPPAPTVVSPSGALTVSDDLLFVSGSGAPYADAVLFYINGVRTGGVAEVSAQGAFSGSIRLGEGVNQIQVAATNRAGTGARSGAVAVTLDTSVPAAPLGLSASSKESGTVRLSWTAPFGEDVKGFNVYRAASAFTSKAQATKLNTTPVTSTVYNDLPPADGTYYYRVTALNQADTEGLLSAQATGVSDSTAPRVTLITYTPVGPYDPASGRYGVGRIDISATVSEPLLTTPFLSINPEGGSPVSLTLSKASLLRYTASFTAQSDVHCGTAWAVFSGRDMAGNRGTAIDAGQSILLDACGPDLADFQVTPAEPIANDPLNPTTVTVVAVFDADDLPVGTPQLHWRLTASHPTETAVTLAPLTSYSWWGSFVLPVDAGASPEYLEFSYAGLDNLGNTGTTIRTDHSLQVYQGDLPPYAAPDYLVGEALPGGYVQLHWRAVSGAAQYSIYGGDTALALAPIEEGHSSTSFVYHAGNSTNWYAVASLRDVNGQVSTSALSAVVRVVADEENPPAPEDLSLQLVGKGILLEWTANSGDTESYRLYRDTSEILSVGGRTPLTDHIPIPIAEDLTPIQGESYYAVTARDAAGNESTPSASAYTNVALLPVNSLRVQRIGNGFPVLTWSHPNTGGIDGYRIYLGEAGEENLLQGGLSASASTYIDSGFTRGAWRYTIAAVDDLGAGEVESLRRAIELPDLTAIPVSTNVLNRGVMNRLYYTVNNGAGYAVSNARLHVQYYGRDHLSDLFNIGISTSKQISVVVGGYSNLADWVVMTNTLEIAPDSSESVRLSSLSSITVDDDLMTGELLNEAFARGALGYARFVVHNTSDEEIEIITATGNGASASPEVRLKLVTDEGMVLAVQPVKQAFGNVLTIAEGVTVARIPAGGSFTSEPVQMPVPSSAPDTVRLVLEIDAIHYRYGEPEHVKIGGLTTTRDISLQETYYYAGVTNITPVNSMGDEDILIEGHAVNRASGQPQPNVPVKLVISVNGFERTHRLYGDSTGHWGYSFSPLANEAGVYRVWAVHPDLLDKPLQGMFAISRVQVGPTIVNMDLARGLSRNVSIAVQTSAGLSLTNVYLQYDAADQVGGVLPTGMHVVTPAPFPVIASGGRANLIFEVWGDDSAAASGSLVLKLKSDPNPLSTWTAVTVNYQIHAAEPLLWWSPNYVDTGVAIGNRVQETVVMENRGYGSMQGLTLALLKPDGTPAPAWVVLNTSTNLGDLAVGAQKPVGITFAPTEQVSEETHAFKLRVRSANHAQTDINLYASVDGSGVGGALFRVVDMYTDTLDGQGIPIEGLAGARVALQKETGSQLRTNLTTDATGEVLFENLPVGSYVFRITATAHEGIQGRLWIKPGVVASREVFLQSRLVTVEWSVAPTTIEDEYNIVLRATFETEVPAAVVVIDPSSITVPDMEAGDVFNGEFRLINHGLIRADDVLYQPPAENAYFKFELLADIPEVLAAHEVVSMPYRIVCKQSPLQEDGDSGGNYVRCHSYVLCGYASYSYTCASGHKGEASSWGCWTYWVTAAEGGSCNYQGVAAGVGVLDEMSIGLRGAGGGSGTKPQATGLKGGSMGCAPGCTGGCCPRMKVER